MIPLNSGENNVFKRVLKYVISLGLVLLVVSFGLFSCAMKKASKSYASGIKNVPYDVIIVPGYPFDGEKWHDVMRMRVHWSKFLYTSGYTKNVIYSGSAVYTPYVEAEIMRLYALELGIPEDVIFAETNAEHSSENVYYSLQKADSLGFKKVALATDPYQTALLKYFINKHDLNINYLPVVIDTLKTLDRYTPIIDPSTAKIENFESIKDREGLWRRLRGTLGYNIKELK
ncbi:YdcF family protein [Marinigracilibium pacificum]|uniref:YdcF family protein n=1 Tax=Marinigracilibium pacificum TaxID=2729599 RepID=A0A848IXI3_9BACT|nr:YdcF family protein [Marinigracilibium pacificum]NMM47878.1 YdcF family protein [Marinigracilibium pacificum]